MRPKSEHLVLCGAWLVFVAEASAHPPHIEPWKHFANTGVSVISTIVVGYILKTKVGNLAAVIGGVLTFLIFIIAGYILTFVSSL